MDTTTNRQSRTGGTRGKTRFSKNSNKKSGQYGKQSGFRGGKPHGGRGFAKGGKRGGGGRTARAFNPSQFINTNPTQTEPEAYTPDNAHDELGLSQKLVANIAALKMTAFTPIQDKIIPEMLAGRDVIGLAQTGTGKTAAFLIPIIEQTLADDTRQTLILTPTRELALQINQEMQNLTRGLRIFSTVCVGGANIHPQIKSLRRKNHFIIGTPGRTLDLINRGCFVPKHVTTVVLDEADRMLDMGFIHDIRRILSYTPKSRSTHLFSATMDARTKTLVNEFLNNPFEISVKKQDVAGSIEQNVVPHGRDKFETLRDLLGKPEFTRVLVFGAMKHSVEKLSKQLSASGVKAESIHGNKSHGQRQRALQAFKKGDVSVLVATDVAARGIHVDDVSHVINYDLPETFEDYVHRIGRTGRGSKQGKALTFVPGK